MRWGLRSAVGMAFAVVMLLPACFWRQPGAGPGNTRYNPQERWLTSTNVAQLHEAWSVDLPGAALTEPVSDGARLYMTRLFLWGIAIDARDPDSGELLWTQTLADPVTGLKSTAVALSGQDLAVSYFSDGPEPHCATAAVLDAASGEVLHTEPIGDPQSPTLTMGSVAVRVDHTSCGSTLGYVLDVSDTTTRTTRWTATLDVALVTGLIIADGKIFVSDWSGVAAFPIDGCGAPTCSPLWTRTFPPDTAATGLAQGPRGTVFVNYFVTVPEEPPEEPPTQSRYGGIRAIDSATGADRWRTEVHGEGSPSDAIVQGIVVAGDTIVTTTQTAGSGAFTYGLAAYRTSGCDQAVCAPTWSAPLPGETLSPVGAGDVVYTHSTDGALRAFAVDGCGATTCPPLVTVPLEDAPERLSTSGEHVFAVTYNGTGRTLHALTVDH